MNRMNSSTWICILLCASILLPCFALESSKISKSGDNLLIPSDPEGHGTSSKRAVMKANEDSDDRKLTASESISWTEKGKGAKGTNGGSNIVHQRPGEKNGAGAVFYVPYFTVLLAFLGFSFFPLPSL